MTGARKTIYAKDREVWDRIEAEAIRIDRSVSWLVIQRCLDSIGQTEVAKPADLEKHESRKPRKVSKRVDKENPFNKVIADPKHGKK